MKILKNILIMMLLLFLFSCEETTMPLFDAKYTFVSITDGSYSITKNSTKLLEIPVVIAGIKGADVTVTFSVEESGDNPAKEGIDYSIVNVDKKVTVSGGAGSAFVQIKPLNNPDAVGDKTFRIKLVSNSAGFYMAEDANETEAKISDSNNPLAVLVGHYEQIDYVWGETKTEGPYDEDVVIDIDSKNDNMVTITNFWGGGEVIKAKVDLTKNSLQISAGQIIYIDDNYGNCQAVAIDVEKEEYDETASINGTWTEDGTITFGAWAALVDAGAFGNYEKSVLTKISE
jgi:hypothetical protein